MYVKRDGQLVIYNSEGDLERNLRPRLKTETWYWVEILQKYRSKEKVIVMKVLRWFFVNY